jgi:hypothetical protein
MGMKWDYATLCIVLCISCVGLFLCLKIFKAVSKDAPDFQKTERVLLAGAVAFVMAAWITQV